MSFGTEGRRGGQEIEASDQIYEYIVFRGSDVKDLRIEETPAAKEPPQPPAVPDDPAIVGVSVTCHFPHRVYRRLVLLMNYHGCKMRFSEA